MRKRQEMSKTLIEDNQQSDILDSNLDDIIGPQSFT